MVMIPLGTVGELLGISRVTATRVMESGVLGPVEKRGTRSVVGLDRILAIQARPEADLVAGPRALVVRVGNPQAAEDHWREYAGWSEAWPESTKMDAVRGDWRLRLSSVELPMGLVAVSGPVVVAVYSAISAEVHGDRLRFDLVPANEYLRNAYEGKLVKMPAGPSMARIGK